MEAQVDSHNGRVLGTLTTIMVEVPVKTEEVTPSTEEVMEEEVLQAEDSDSAASADSQLARDTHQVELTPPEGVSQEQWQETLSTIESEVSESRSGFESRAGTSRDAEDGGAEDDQQPDGWDSASREVLDLCGEPTSDDDQGALAETQASLLAQIDELTGDGADTVETAQTESELAPDSVVGTLMVRVARTTLGNDSDSEDDQDHQLAAVDPGVPVPVAVKLAADADPIAGQGDASSAEDL